MKIILNYKSYYEAFKLDVTDNGFTDVARLLFYPIFDLNLYNVDNANASVWGNGYKTIPKEIQIAVGKKCLRRSVVINYSCNSSG